ncbi:MAG: undecaprenyl-diphosphate phosphatase [Butyrivibrio sp.]|nr:undecaprenyl-diphosphate phosphatase [Butyrivibrio sp.]
MLDFLKAILFGIVEGITEWLPVSSTGHMILLDEFVKMNVSEEFWNLFLVVIQLGAILAVVILFWDKIFPFDFSKEARAEHRVNRKDVWLLWVKILISCVPAAVIGVLFDDVFDRLFYNGPCVAIALIVFGIAFIAIETAKKGKEFKINSISEITYKTALYIGFFQVLAAIFPGTSRSGATIVGALLIGVARTVAAEYTFYLAIPVMAGASLLKVLKFDGSMTGSEFMILLVGTVVAFAVSIVVIRFLMGYIRKHDFKVFGVYRIILGLVVLIYFGMR